MNNQVKSLSVEHDTAGPRDPLRKWWEPSRRFNQEAGPLPLLDLGGPRRTDWLERSLWSCYWPGYSPVPLFVPHICGSMHRPGPSAGPEQYKWRVGLDVSQFSPSEISLSVKDGFLQVGGMHDERPDEHGFVSRCFTRKYRLPAEIDVTKIVSSLSVDGILTVEAPVPAPTAPATIIIPIKVEKESSEHEAEKSSHPKESKAADVHEDSSAKGEVHEGKRDEDKSEKTVSKDQEGSESHEDAQEKRTEEEIARTEEDPCKGCEISQEIL